MSIQSEIDRIITAVGSAYDAVESKGGTAPAAQTIEGLAGAISGIKSAPATPYMEAEYVAVEDGGGTSHCIKRAKLYNHTRIYAHEFEGQNKLQELDYSDPSNSITVIETRAFANSCLDGVVLPNALTNLGEDCFYRVLMGTLTIPSLVTILPMGAFRYARPSVDSETGEEKQINIILPQSLVKIGDSCFEGTSIQQIAIPDTVTEIGRAAFDTCERLRSITIPPLLQKIPESLFRQCKSLTAITIPATVTEIGRAAFMYTGITHITIPKSVTTLGNYVLADCQSLTTIDIQANVTEIPESFAARSGRTSVTLPNTVQTIKGYAFYSYTAKLTEITIPASVTSIGNSAFAQNESMETVTCLAATPPTLGRNAFTLATGSVIKVPAASVAAYKAATNWSQYANYIVGV